MAPKGVSKAVNKRCPACKKQIPVATRHCSCGHPFYEDRNKPSALTLDKNRYLNCEVDRESSEVSQQQLQLSAPLLAMLGNKQGAALAGAAATDGADGGKRRSERVKREKPNFYDALEYENKMRKARRERQKDEPQPQTSASGRAKRERRPRNSSPDEEYEDEPIVKEKKRRKKKRKLKKEEEEEDEDIMAGISPHRAMSFSYVLADINLKLGLNNPKFT